MQRNTSQRKAIRRAFLEIDRPMTPPDVHAAARKHCSRLGIATVYRTLKGLCQEGWLVPFDLPGESVTYYERTQSHHHHFVCRRCKQLFKVECLAQDFQKLIPAGFVLEDHEFLLYGVCVTCNRGKGRSRRGSGGKPKR